MNSRRPRIASDGLSPGPGFQASEGVIGEGHRTVRSSKQGDREGERDEVDVALADRRAAAAEQVGVAVAEQEQQLEEQHAGGPHGRGAAEPRQDLLADDELDLEQQAGADADRGGEQEHGERAGRRRGHQGGAA